MKKIEIPFVIILIVGSTLFSGCVDSENKADKIDTEEYIGNNISSKKSSFIDHNNTTTKPEKLGKITIDKTGEFEFDPSRIHSIRGDIFKEGYFSVFDILAYLDSNGSIDMEYHFDESMNTYIIDSINERTNWWYMAYYDGGWPEKNVFRMDHYPYKDKMYIEVFKENSKHLKDIHEVFKEELKRKKENEGKVIIPEVTIKGPSTNLKFENVEVLPHNLRNDIFQPGVITAIDVIMSLEDQGKITYDVLWYESIGTADIVKNYYVEKINNDISYGRCGFVYEDGDNKFRGGKGNHIHVQSDIRVLNSPNYQDWFWICI